MILEEHPKRWQTGNQSIGSRSGRGRRFLLPCEHKTWDAILHDIRKAHENDSESAPETTPADELIRKYKRPCNHGDRVQQFTEIFCKAFRLKYSGYRKRKEAY
jgi:hypothetical protein